MSGRRSSGIGPTRCDALEAQRSPQVLTILLVCGDDVMKASGTARVIAFKNTNDPPACTHGVLRQNYWLIISKAPYQRVISHVKDVGGVRHPRHSCGLASPTRRNARRVAGG